MKALSAERYCEQDINSACDVCFNILDVSGLKWQLYAHKVVLGAFSPVFKQQFFGPLKPSMAEDIVRVDVKDFSYLSFKFFLDIIYGDCEVKEFGGDFDRLFDLLMLADKYQNSELFKRVRDHMWSFEVRPSNAIGILAEVFKHKDLLNMELLCESLKCKCQWAVLQNVSNADDVSKLWAKKTDNPGLFEYLIDSELFCDQLAKTVDKSMHSKQDVYDFMAQNMHHPKLNTILISHLSKGRKRRFSR